MFEGKEDKKKKVYPACPICWARRIHLLIMYSYESKKLLSIFVILLDIRICVDFALRNSRNCFVIVTIE